MNSNNTNDEKKKKKLDYCKNIPREEEQKEEEGGLWRSFTWGGRGSVCHNTKAVTTRNDNLDKERRGRKSERRNGTRWKNRRLGGVHERGEKGSLHACYNNNTLMTKISSK